MGARVLGCCLVCLSLSRSVLSGGLSNSMAVWKKVEPIPHRTKCRQGYLGHVSSSLRVTSSPILTDVVPRYMVTN